MGTIFFLNSYMSDVGTLQIASALPCLAHECPLGLFRVRRQSVSGDAAKALLTW